MFFGTQLDLVLVCIVVVLGRIVDMSLATMRTVFTVKNKPGVAASIGFIEAFFWFLVVKAALDYVISNPVRDTIILAIAYSLGFALGTYLGGLLSKSFVKTMIHVQIVLKSKDDDFVEALRENNFGATILSCKGANKKTETYLVMVETDSKKLKLLKQLVDKFDNSAFISVSESKSVYNGYFSPNRK